jgi:uncharacterized membrane protein
MDKMLIAIFDTTPQALKGVIELRALHRAGDIKLCSTAVIAKDASGWVSIKQASERESNGVLLGSLAGILLGALGGSVGLVIGGSIAGLVGLIFDITKAGVGADFIKEASQALPLGKVALMAEIDETSEAPVDRKLVKLGGQVYRRERSEFMEEQLLDALDAINVELS